MKLVGYARVSTQGQADNTSLEEQKKRIRAYCYAFGHELLEIFEEVGSGQRASTRPQFQLALDLVRDRADGIIAVKLDRIARNARDVLALVEDVLKPENKNLVLLDLNVDTSTPTGRAILAVMAAVAQLECEIITERCQGGRKAKSEAGGYAFGSPPYGFRAEDSELVEVSEEQEVIELIRRHHKSGKSQQAIADWLNSQGYKPRRGQIWRQSAIANILTRLHTHTRKKRSS